MSRATAIPGFRIKDGKVEKDPRRLNVSKQLQIKSSKRIRPARKGHLR